MSKLCHHRTPRLHSTGNSPEPEPVHFNRLQLKIPAPAPQHHHNSNNTSTQLTQNQKNMLLFLQTKVSRLRSDSSTYQSSSPESGIRYAKNKNRVIGSNPYRSLHILQGTTGTSTSCKQCVDPDPDPNWFRIQNFLNSNLDGNPHK